MIQDSKCKLLEGTLTYFLQFILALISLGGIYYKWKHEYPQRQTKVVLFDVGKQISGMGFAHILNILIAILMTKRITVTDECRWYFINFNVDVVFGTLLNWLILKRFNKYIEKKNWNIMDTGSYKTSNNCVNKSFVYQTLSWIAIIFAAKLIILAIILMPLAEVLNSYGRWVLGPVSHNIHLELTIVMVVFPLIFNVIQFWIQDTFLRGKKHYMSTCLLEDLENRGTSVKKVDNISTSDSYSRI